MSNWYFFECEARIKRKEINEEINRAWLTRLAREANRDARETAWLVRLGRFLVWLGLKLQKLDRVQKGAAPADLIRPVG